ncbi:phosphoribosyltransferase [Listeria seeligeri]|uniref:phosphoribosyltransferase n=1 Tax=Listeria seeligeri TaxID=1640 RepID=UPI00162520E4|nr:phosphoribosyltransferase [Listeria seeligeri]MBC1753411.1 phosphoribosyltransferase [Listeria seeligeri]MBC1786958.1 phosphoribosyltransferase [Listeria seeligeri]MBC2233921.1 phosphoribosyltransferase [Listeria seeligeri]
MNMHIILPRATIFDQDDSIYDGVLEMLEEFEKREYDVIFVSHQRNKHELFESSIHEKSGLDVKFRTRNDLRTILKDPDNKECLKTVIVVGSSDNDLHLATNFKLLLINPEWSHIKESKPIEYGFSLKSPEKVTKMINIIKNQQSWFFELEIDSNCKLYALTSANNNSAIGDEEAIINEFRKILKEGSNKNFEALFFHFIASVMKSDELREIDLWSIMPSSGTTLNEDMLEIKERCRYLNGRKKKSPLFIRHKRTRKSHETSTEERLRIGAKKHLETINLNPEYKKFIKGKVVCVIDDYITNGASFEALRNILIKAGAKKVIFVAIGRYKKGTFGVYQKEDYRIDGDVFSTDYSFELIDRNPNFGENGKYDTKAKEEVGEIYNILYR